MITAKPDLSLNLPKLEQEIQAFREEVLAGKQWYIREKYVDRSDSDPFYIIHFSDNVDDKGDDLMGETAFATKYSFLKAKQMTRSQDDGGFNYWQLIQKWELWHRLDQFMFMYRTNYLQPPGYLYDSRKKHQRFYKKRFIFQIRSPGKNIIGIGPSMFAGTLPWGAIRGRLTNEDGRELEGVRVELISREGITYRITDKDGLFWFSKIPFGDYHIRVKGRICSVQVLKEGFGNIEGNIYYPDGGKQKGAAIELKAPDEEYFKCFPDFNGRFSTGPLPAFPYILEIPGCSFTAAINVISNAVIGGTVLDRNGAALQNKTLILKQNGCEIAWGITDDNGNFIFTGLKGGEYTIETPGYDLFSRKVVDSDIQGKFADPNKSVKVELIAREKTISETCSFSDGTFKFHDLVPGNYSIYSSGTLLKTKEEEA